MKTDFTVGVVGNPNCGKTTLFNALTGARQHVGNWPGVTVEKKTGEYSFDHKLIELVDLPGTYSLEAADDQVSLDEKVARDYVASKQADLIINIVDASNLERNLYLTSQLIEMRVPMILVLNMMDAVKQRGIKIDVDFLEQFLGCPVIPITASIKGGIGTLKSAINSAAIIKPIPSVKISLYPALEQAINDISPLLVETAQQHHCDLRWLAVRLLEDDTLAKQFAGTRLLPTVSQLQRRVEAETDDEIDILAADARYGFVNELTSGAVCKLNEVSRHTTDKIDNIVLNRFLGIPVFLLVMYAMFMFTINIGSAFVDFFDQSVGALLIDGLSLDAHRPELAAMADCINHQWRRRRHSGCRYLYPHRRLSVHVPVGAGRFRLHVQGGFRDGQIHAHDRLARQILRADDRRFRLQCPGDYGDADPGKPARPDIDQPDESVHVLRRQIAGLRLICRRIFPGRRPESGVRLVFVGHRSRGTDRFNHAPHPV